MQEHRKRYTQIILEKTLVLDNCVTYHKTLKYQSKLCTRKYYAKTCLGNSDPNCRKLSSVALQRCESKILLVKYSINEHLNHNAPCTTCVNQRLLLAIKIPISYMNKFW